MTCSGLVVESVEWVARTSVDLTVIVNDTTFHAVGPAPRDHTGWRFLRVKVLGVGLLIGPVRSKHLLEFIDFKGVSSDPVGCRSTNTCNSSPLDDLDVPNARDDRVVDLEDDSDTKIIPAVSADRAGLSFAYLYSTPSLIETGFFFRFSSNALSWRSKLIFLPGGRVGESSCKATTVT